MSTKQTNSKEIRASKQPNVPSQQPSLAPVPQVQLTELDPETIAIVQHMATTSPDFRERLDSVVSSEKAKIEAARKLLGTYGLMVEEAPATRRNAPGRKPAAAQAQKASNQAARPETSNRAGRPVSPETKAMGEKTFTYIKSHPDRSAGEICGAVGFEKSKWNSIKSYLGDRIVMTGERRDARYKVA